MEHITGFIGQWIIFYINNWLSSWPKKEAFSSLIDCSLCLRRSLILLLLVGVWQPPPSKKVSALCQSTSAFLISYVSNFSVKIFRNTLPLWLFQIPPAILLYSFACTAGTHSNNHIMRVLLSTSVLPASAVHSQYLHRCPALKIIGRV